MNEAILLRLKLFQAKLDEAVKEATVLCEQFQTGVTVEELNKNKAQLNTYTKKLQNEVHLYIQQCTDISQEVVKENTDLQLKAEDIIITLDNILKSASYSHENSQTKLPKLNLPSFNGDLLKWHDFWDQFEASVDRKSLPEVEKLAYLISSLRDNALEAIQGLSTTTQNYRIAVDTLKSRFGNKSILIDSHYEELHKLQCAGSSIEEYRRILNCVEKNLRILQSLGEDIESNHLRYTILNKFPEKIVYELNLTLGSNNSVKAIRKQLELIITAMEQSKRTGANQGGTFSKIPKEVSTTDALLVREKRGAFTPKPRAVEKRKLDYKKSETNVKRWKGGCAFCGGQHYSDLCRKYVTLNIRKGQLGTKCHLCFRTGHYIRNCQYKKKCYYCNGHHNRALCPKKFADKIKSKSLHSGNISKTKDSHCYVLNQHSFLQTATGMIRNQTTIRNCRLLLDSGSQRSYISQQLANDLCLVMDKEDQLIIFTFGSEEPTKTLSPRATIEVITKRGIIREIQVNVVPHITDRIPVPKTDISFNVDLLADNGSQGEGVNVLIGNDYYYSFFKSDNIQLQDNLYLINTDFGWIFSGRGDMEQTDRNVLSVVTYCQCDGPECTYYTQPDLPLRSTDLAFLWSLESIGIADSPKTTREDEAVKQFNNTVKYVNQRYVVKWPWIQYPPEMPTNFGLAYGRLKGLLQRMDKSTINEYEAILKQQLISGVIEMIDPESEVTNQRVPPIHYLPHHMVKQGDKKGRIVYDASSKVKNQKSLNECLYRGPSLIEDLLAILLHFRTYEVAFTADVEKAFLQIGLQEKDRDVTRFLWLTDVTKPISVENLLHFRFCRVPFGVISSPFLLNATIRHHLSQKNKKLMPTIASKCYVDNLVTSVDSVDTAVLLYKEIRKEFGEMSMNMRDWISSNSEFLKNIPESQRAKHEEEKGILGLIWNLKRDTLQLKIRNTFEPLIEGTTKREVLRILAKIYDPCGYASPVTLQAKLFFQNLCNLKLKWDEVIPDQLQSKWRDIQKSLKAVETLEIPRHIGARKGLRYELHCFTDAAKNAYAAVVYLRVTDQNQQQVSTSLLMSKSKVTPIKDQDQLKIPRLELLAFLIGSRLIQYVANSLDLAIARYILWTDSLIVLAWMKTDKLLPPFVSRRVNEIKKNKEIEMRYVNTRFNPADIGTRPELWGQKQDLWFKGPYFLTKLEEDWPVSEQISEVKTFCLVEEDQDVMDNPDFEESDDLTEFKYEAEGLYEISSSAHLDGNLAEVKKLQRNYFPEEISGKETHLTRNLGIYLDVDGVLRCRGRMSYANWPYDMKHPALIPRDCEFTIKLIQKVHEKNYHVGVSHTLSLIREKFWIPQGRAQVQKVLRNCPQCVKHGGGPYKLPSTPALPPERVNFSAPFTFTGMDYFGPLYINGDLGKEKRWVCLFTCLAVRAIHMEMVKNLTAEECLLALRRFIAVRGLPETIYSDNATLFKLTSEVLADQIKWKFIPQLAPWHGGFYERMIGLVKHCMKRTLEKHTLGESQVLTVIKEIEYVVNTRPLTNIGSESEHILTPGDFLTLGRCLTLGPASSPVGEETVTKHTLIESWKRGQNIMSEFKRMFITQYLFNLREKYNSSPRQPRVTTIKVPCVGDIVQIKNDSRNRNTWKVGKIISLVNGADGACRVAKVKVGETELTRSIGHLYPLEMDVQRETNKELQESSSEAIPVEKNLNEVPIEESLSQTEELVPDDSMNPEYGIEEVIPHTDTEMLEVGQQSGQLVQNSSDLALSESLENSAEVEAEVIPNVEEKEQGRVKRRSALKAREKMAEWTRNLLTLL